MEKKKQGTGVAFKPQPLPPEIAMEEGAPKEKGVVDWLPTLGVVLMAIGALGPAGSAQSRATSLQFATQNLDMLRQMREAEAERKKEILMNRETLRSQERRVEEQMRRQDRLLDLKEEELQLERERLERLSQAFQTYIMMELKGEDEGKVLEALGVNPASFMYNPRGLY